MMFIYSKGMIRLQQERLITVLNLGINALITFIKVYGGMVFGSYTLIVSGYYTLCDMCNEFVAFMGSVVKGRRANQKEPFGFGKKECISYLIFGVILILVAIYIFIRSLFLNYVLVDAHVIFVVAIIIILKWLFNNQIFNVGKMIQSLMLINTSSNAIKDIILTIIALLIVGVASIYKIFDLVGVLFISIFIMLKGLKIVVDNIILVKGQNDKNKKIEDSVKKIVKENTSLVFDNLELVNVNKYYKANIILKIESNMSLIESIKNKRKIKKLVKKQNDIIKMVDIEIYVK